MHKKIQIEDTIYTANTDFRVAIECNRIATDETIGDYERVLGIICTMFGAEAIDNPKHYEKLLKWTLNYLSGGKEIQNVGEEPDMDYIEDAGLIASSFKYDYKYNPYSMEYLSWDEFFNDLNNLSYNVELGNCCALSRARYWRGVKLSEIKDPKERKRASEIKKYYALKKYKKENHLTKEQEESMRKLNEMLGL